MVTTSRSDVAAPSTEVGARTPPHELRERLRKLLAVLHIAVAVAAVVGGAALVADPTGAVIGLERADLRGLDSFFVPGLLLFALAAVQLVAGVLCWRGGARGLRASEIGGGLLTLWIAFETAMVLPIHPLQVFAMLLGAFIFMVAHELYRDAPHKTLLP